MGAWYISKADSNGLGIFLEQHPFRHVVRNAGEFDVHVAGPWCGSEPTIADGPEGEFLGIAGFLIYGERSGPLAAPLLLRDLLGKTVRHEQVGGAYAAVFWDGERLSIFSDWLGNVCIYRTTDASVWSTSFLATASSVRSRTLNLQACYEYVFLESPFGMDTACEEVIRVPPEPVHSVDGSPIESRTNSARVVDPAEEPLEVHVERNIQALAPIFDAMVGSFGNRIDTALSGGYDSRLLLALLRARGCRPRLHVYGGPEDADVVVAKSISRGEDLAIDWTDKRSYVDDDDPETGLRKRFLAFDGYPGDGIFSSADLKTRCARLSSGFLALNGGGGEIFRNFYYIANRSMSALDLLRTFYARFDPSVCTELFDTSHYFSVLARKLRVELHTEASRLSRTDVERSFPLFRCRFWMARNTSNNTRLGLFHTPLVEPRVIQAALKTPLRMKNHGLLESAMIESVDPRLASYPSAYGRAFDSAPGTLERVKGELLNRRTVWLRRNTYRMKLMLSRAPVSWPADVPHLGEGLNLVRRLFDVQTVRDTAQLTRILNLAYLADSLEFDEFGSIRP